MESAPKVGEVGRGVAAHVRHLRDDRRMSLRDLSERLGEAGRPVLPSGIVKLEQGMRRIDVDDLVALASVLGVSPAQMLDREVEVVIDTKFVEDHGAEFSRLRSGIRSLIGDGFTPAQIVSYTRLMAALFASEAAEIAASAEEDPDVAELHAAAALVQEVPDGER